MLSRRSREKGLKPSITLVLSVIIVLGALNAVFRLPGTSLSGFYLVAPIVISWLWLTSADARLRAMLVGLVFGYGWLAGLLYGTPMRDMIVQTAFYFLAVTMMEVVLCWKRNSRSFERDAERLFDLLAGAAFLIFVLQLLLNFDVPGTWGYRMYGYGTAYFYTPNDLALYLTAYLVVVLFGPKPTMAKIAIAGGVFLVNLTNDARAAMVVCLAAPLVWLIVPLLARRFAYPALVFLAGGGALAVSGLLAAATFGIDDAASAVEGVERVITLNPFMTPGSIFNRIDALIFNLIEMNHSWWLGLGPGGTVYVLTMPQYDAMTAQSLHNAVVELAFDLGPAFYIPFSVLFMRLFLHYLLAERLALADLGRFAFLLFLPFMGVVQSSGYISNYAFWAAAVFIWVRDGQTETQPSVSMRNAPWMKAWRKTRAIAIVRSSRRKLGRRFRVQP